MRTGGILKKTWVLGHSELRGWEEDEKDTQKGCSCRQERSENEWCSGVHMNEVFQGGRRYQDGNWELAVWLSNKEAIGDSKRGVSVKH